MARKVATTKPKPTTSKRKATTAKRKSTPKKRATAKTTRKTVTKKYSPTAGKEVAKEMRKFKKGTAKSGKAGAPVKSRKQAIAIGLSKARAKGAKVPRKRS